MAVRRVARFHNQSREPGHPSRLRAALIKTLLRLLDLVAVSVAIVLVIAPFAWKMRRRQQLFDGWSQVRMNDVSRLETDWMTLPRVPGFSRGDEPALVDLLRAQPLVLAVQDRGSGALWLRQGDRLVPAGLQPEAATIRDWFTQAQQAQCFIWYPMDRLPDEARAGPKIVLLGDHWLVAKRWQEGSPEVERALRNLFGAAPTFRVLLLKDGDEQRKDLLPQAWGEEPNIQADPARINGEAPFTAQMISNEFPGWSLNAIPNLAEARAIRRSLRTQFLLAALAAGAVGGSLVLALYLRARARRKTALDSDRMAAMTHSLKTPLAILKFRCDTLRLGRHDPDHLDAQLIQIGEEADRLSGIIENALTAIQGQRPRGPQEAVTPQWLIEIGEDLAPAFEAEDRRLVVVASEHLGLAALPSLRAALFTLVENALFHGTGTVTLESLRVRKRLLLRVSDQGSELGALDLKALGRPFMRIREGGQEGFRKEGQGLGLSLLLKMVEQEGWGLVFASEPGQGLCATLEIPGAPAAP